jgi:formate dehydrogenase major subunit
MSNQWTRREVLKTGAAFSAGASLYGFDVRPAAAQARQLKISRTTQTHSVCPYCAVGCGVIIHTLGDKSRNVNATVVHVEGDPDSPINRGTLCPQGILLKQFIVNQRRLTHPLYRPPGGREWQRISWTDAFAKMARLIKATRDRSFEVEDSEGRVVNRWTNVSMIGGCTDTNEINFLLGKMRFGLGIIAYENQARL